MQNEFLNSLLRALPDINEQLNGISSLGSFGLNEAPIGSGLQGHSAVERNYEKKFIIGFIPPRYAVDFQPIEVINERLSTPTPSNQEGQSASAGVNTVHPNGATKLAISDNSPGEVAKTRTPVTYAELGSSYAKHLESMGYSQERIATLVPLLVAHNRTEVNANHSGLNPFNYNLGNLHASGRGVFEDPKHPNTSKIKTMPPTPKGGKYVLMYDHDPATDTYYPVYMQASVNLDDATANKLNWLQKNWPGVFDANNAEDYTRALRPDLFPDVPSPQFRGQYFAADYNRYRRTLTSCADEYVKAHGGLVSSSGPVQYQSIVGQGLTPGEKPDQSNTSVRIMTSSSVTDEENDDPLHARRGKNIRVTTDKIRYEVVKKQVDAINAQVEAVANTPPLALLINPTEFRASHEHQVDTAKGRRRNIVNIWMEKPISITGNGVTAGQYVVDSTGSGGLTSTLRVQSLSYLNLMSLVRIYKNNGNIYTDNDQNFGSGNSGIQLIPMSIYIYYDGHVYIGSFSSFSITDSAEKPHSLAYSFGFTAVYDVDVTSISENLLSGIEA
jgi:hypothetical protein